MHPDTYSISREPESIEMLKDVQYCVAYIDFFIKIIQN
jgi:hypothetical protein